MTGFSLGTNPTPAFGASSSAPSFGFGTNTSTQSTGFGFGGSTFGQPASSASGIGFGAAAAAAATTTSSTFGFGTGFGQPASAASFGGFGGSTTGTTGGGLFGTKPVSSTGFNLTGGTGLFSTPKSTVSGFNFGSNTLKVGGFGAPNTATQPFQPGFLQQQQQQQSIDPNVALYMAVCAPAYFNDERDEVLKKWNQLQAMWGKGKGYYAQNVPPVDITPDNPFCRFKSVGYVKLPSFSPEDGFVEIIIGRKEAEVKQHQQQIVDTLVKVFENSQVCVDYVSPLDEDKTRLCIYVQQRSPNGETKKAQAWQVYNHLNAVNHRQTLQNICVESATPLVSLSESQLKEYLDNPPQGLDPIIWEQGKRANPDTKVYLPVPMVGFKSLKSRFKAQEDESKLLQGQLDVVADEITQLRSKQARLVSDVQECRRKQMLMSHRVLRLVIKQEINRKRGVPIEPGEEHLRMLLEALHTQLAAPTQYMGRLNELVSQISVQPGLCPGSAPEQSRYNLDPESEKELHQFLAWEQDAIKETVNIVKKDMEISNALLSNEKK